MNRFDEPAPNGYLLRVIPVMELRSMHLRHKIFHKLQKILRLGSLPGNYQKRNSKPETIKNDLEQALAYYKGYMSLCEKSSGSVEGKTILELGPGINLAPLLLLACRGAKPIAVDRFLATWDKDYHPILYSALLKAVRTEGDINTEPLERVLKKGGYTEDVITLIETPAESLDGVGTGSIDIVLSNAVLEHVEDVALSFKNIARVTRPGGNGFHQVDFRDHRDFDTPLEFLLLPDDLAKKMFDEGHGEMGNRMRPSEMKNAIEMNCLEVELFNANMFADDKYIKGLLPRLRASAESSYKDTPLEELKILSGMFYVNKPKNKGKTLPIQPES